MSSSHSIPPEVLRGIIPALGMLMAREGGGQEGRWGEAREEAHNRRRCLVLLLRVASDCVREGGLEAAAEAVSACRTAATRCACSELAGAPGRSGGLSVLFTDATLNLGEGTAELSCREAGEPVW